jgi:DNA-directed RNA polymerase subunit beta'
MIIPEKKWDILKQADLQVSEIGRNTPKGLITQGEKYNKVVDIWAKATDDVANEMMDAMKVAPVMDAGRQPGWTKPAIRWWPRASTPFT